MSSVSLSSADPVAPLFDGSLDQVVANCLPVLLLGQSGLFEPLGDSDPRLPSLEHLFLLDGVKSHFASPVLDLLEVLSVRMLHILYGCLNHICIINRH